MKVRLKNQPTATGGSNRFNVHGLFECLVGWDDDPDGTPNGADSSFIRVLDVWIEALKGWKDMGEAFRDRDIIPNNYNTHFGEPTTPKDRARGYSL